MKKGPIYINRKVLNYQDIVDWAKDVGFTTMLPEDHLHVTIVYCKKDVDWSYLGQDYQPEMLEIKPSHNREVDQFGGGATVLEFHSRALIKRSRILAGHGIKSKHAEYRAHITITYNKPDDLNIKDIPPYTGAIILGPENYQPIEEDWQEGFEEIDLDDVPVLNEEHLNDFDADKLYSVFKSSYEGATGQAWSKEKFLARASNWTFYGDDDGYVAFREQASGLRKLVGVAGDTKSIMKGLARLMEEDKPVWGAVSDKFARVAKRFGLIAPHLYPGGAYVIRAVMKSIPASVFGGHQPEIMKNGGIAIDYDDLGRQEKFFVANKAYFRYLVESRPNDPVLNNAIVKNFLKFVLK